MLTSVFGQLHNIGLHLFSMKIPFLNLFFRIHIDSSFPILRVCTFAPNTQWLWCNVCSEIEFMNCKVELYETFPSIWRRTTFMRIFNRFCQSLEIPNERKRNNEGFCFEQCTMIVGMNIQQHCVKTHLYFITYWDMYKYWYNAE